MPAMGYRRRCTRNLTGSSGVRLEEKGEASAVPYQATGAEPQQNRASRSCWMHSPTHPFQKVLHYTLENERERIPMESLLACEPIRRTGCSVRQFRPFCDVLQNLRGGLCAP